jgi:SOS-response transcriptional repressor LexA
MKPEAYEFGGFLKMMRKRQRLTVRELEDLSGVSHSYLTQLENGKRGVPSPEILKKLAEPLSINYDELMFKAGYLDSSYGYEAPLIENNDPQMWNIQALFVFGTNVKRLRERLGRSEKSVAKEIGVTLEDYNRIEMGKREISYEVMGKIADYFGKDIHGLLYYRTYFNEDDELKFAHISVSQFSNKRISSESSEQYIKSILEKYKGSIKEVNIGDMHNEMIVKIPIYGTIKAGYDYVAEQNIVGYKVASKSEVSDGEYFYLVVKGDSMIDDGIYEGYHVLVKRQNTVPNGKIGVVIVNGDEATLKRVYYDGDNVILQAANKNIPPRVLPINEVLIQGQVKSVVFDV